MIKFFKKSWWILLPVAALLLSVFLKIYLVSGDSMFPTVKSGSVTISFKYADIKRGDIALCRNSKTGKTLIKRIVGMPGDTFQISEGRVMINGLYLSDYVRDYIEEAGMFTEPVKIPDGYYAVLGDNRNNSRDSREYGLFNKSEIKGKVIFSIPGGVVK